MLDLGVRAGPVRAALEQLLAREAEQHQRRVARVLEQVLDQVEQRRLGPVDVLEDEHERALRRASASNSSRTAHVRSSRGARRLRQAGGLQHPVRDQRGVRVAGEQRLDRAARGSVPPASWRTISASGQKVMPSP